MAAEDPATRRVPVAEHPRLLKLKEMFNAKFGSTPKFYVRAPGRVNIIGEHIDYCGYSVIPMAVEQDMLIAVEPVKTHTLQLANTDPLYPDFSTTANNICIDKTKPLWHNYFLCGFKGIQEHFGLSQLPGMNCLVDGNIPPSSGLSSSSALVCCAGLVTLTVLGMRLSKVSTMMLTSEDLHDSSELPDCLPQLQNTDLMGKEKPPSVGKCPNGVCPACGCSL